MTTVTMTTCTECESTEVASCTICGRAVCPKHRAGSGRIADGYQCATTDQKCWAQRRSKIMTDQELFAWFANHSPAVTPEELREGWERHQATIRSRDNVVEELRYRVEILPETKADRVDVLEYARVPVKGDSIMFAGEQWEVRNVLLWPSPSHVDATVWGAPIEFPRQPTRH